MVGIVLVSHGGMAEGMMSTVSMLWPDVSQMTSLCLWPSDNPDEFQKDLQEKVTEVNRGNGVIILADLLGGTPCNRALYLMSEKVRLLAGLSLPMLIGILSMRDVTDDLDELTSEALSGAAMGSVDVGELLREEQK